MPKDDIAYKKENNSFQKFLSWTREKEILGQKIRSYIKPSYVSLLDIGAGNGDLTKYYADAFSEVTLVEPSAPLFKILSEKFPNAILINKKAEDILVNSNGYDFIVASHVFLYISQPLDYLRELIKGLRPGGILIIITLNPEGEYSRYTTNFVSQVTGKSNEMKGIAWQKLVDFIETNQRNLAITMRTEDVTTYINPPSLDSFLGINDFTFNTDVSNLSEKVLQEMRSYLRQYEKSGGFEINVLHKFLLIEKIIK